MSTTLHDDGLANIAAYNRISLGRRGRGVIERDGVSLCAGPTPAAGPWTNTAVRIDPGVAAADAVDAAAEVFASLGHGFAFWADDRTDGDLIAELRRRGGRPHDDVPVPGMAVDEPVDGTAHAPAISAVRDEQTLDAMCDAIGVAYGFGPGVRGILGAWPIDGSVRAFVLHGEREVCAAAIGVRDRIGGVYMVGTRPEARGRGYGEAVTAAATNAMFADGATAVVLQASAMGEPVYRRMGYRTFTTYSRWLLDAPPS